MIRSIFALLGIVAVLTAFAVAAPTPSPSPLRSAPHAASPAASPLPSASPAASRPVKGSASPNPPPSFDIGVWTIHASSIDANFKNGDFSTPAKVVMTRVGGDVTADRANGNYKKQMLFLNGHVVMHDTQGNYGGLASGAQSQPSGPSTLTADKAQLDGAAKIYKAMGNVHYVQADTVVDADNGTLNDVTHDLLLEGRVHITQGTRNMTAGKVLYNTITGSAHAEGDVTMQFPSEFKRHLATPKPLKLPKNKFTEPVPAPPASP
jgi:lipopolysaccharide assembly outer membrane protein LptD (OstA)